MSKIAYFVPNFDIDASGVFWSQVVAPGLHLNQIGHQVEVCCLAGPDSAAEKKIKEKPLSVRVMLKKYDNSFFGAIRDSVRLAFSLLQAPDFKPEYIYIRSISALLPAFFLSKRKSCQLVYDFRATVSEEYRLKNRKKNLRYVALKMLEYMAIRLPDKFFCVSRGLKQIILNTRPDALVEIVPCCVSSDDVDYFMAERENLRLELGYDSESRVVVYSGGFSEWQRTDDIFQIMKSAMEHDYSLCFMVLTANTERALKLVTELEMDVCRVAILSLSPEKVIYYLQAADIGLLLRADDIVNHVASPIKGAEYLSAGLHILISDAVHDMADIVTKENCGNVISGDNSNIAIQLLRIVEGERLSASHKDHILNVAKKYYSWSSYTDRYNSIYN